MSKSESMNVLFLCHGNRHSLLSCPLNPLPISLEHMKYIYTLDIISDSNPTIQERDLCNKSETNIYN